MNKVFKRDFYPNLQWVHCRKNIVVCEEHSEILDISKNIVSDIDAHSINKS